jgi:hypothetical protein
MVHHLVSGRPLRLSTPSDLGSPRHLESMGPALTMLDRRPPTVVHVTPPVNPQRMVTRAKVGFWVLPDRLVLAVSTSPLTPSPILISIRVALADPNWRAAMEDKYGALMSNETWEFVS